MTTLTASFHTTRKPTVLVVDDNADQWFMIRWALLQRFPEVEAVWAQDADQATQYLDICAPSGRDLPKIVLLDLYLPRREQGWDLLKSIKMHHIYREIPVVMLSQSGDPVDICESYSLRSNSYILKPTSYDKWLDCMASFRHYWWEAVTLPKFV